MLTYELKKAPGLPLYESLYRHLRKDILEGKLAAGEKLPSKRALAENLKVSRITVENAYGQLLSEGYLRTVEKVGYFVEDVAHRRPAPEKPVAQESGRETLLDLTANDPAHFPFSVWNRLQLEVMREDTRRLLEGGPHAGCFALRSAISRQLWDFRGMAVDPENIVIGAGMDFLCNLLIQLLGRQRLYAVEDPGYDKIRRIYDAAGVRWMTVPMDGEGILPEALGKAGVLHISPSHHFPTGIITSRKRRDDLLAWAQKKDGYIIEDDYDSEFRFQSHPMPALQTMDRQGRVIYMNSFSKTLAPSIRISYMVLPEGLMAEFRRKLGFYSCTVSGFEQYTLAGFLSGGHFEKHINRMRKFYKSRRDRVLSALEACPCDHRFTVMEENAGLHFLLRVDTPLSEEVLMERFLQAGIRVRTLGSYYEGTPPEDRQRILVINYSGLDEALLSNLDKLKL